MKQHIGGQAVIEGVMMRSKNNLATAVRLKNGKIEVKKTKIKKKSRYLRFIFIRGIVNLIDQLVIGIKELNWSADIAAGEENEKISSWEIFGVILISLIAGLFLFKFIPLFVTNTIKTNVAFVNNSFIFSLIDGILKIIILILYLWIISSIKDIRKIFQYHGAEHKVVNCYEANQKLTLKNIKKFSTIHLRCGTNFIFTVFLISIFVYTLIPLQTNFFLNLLIRILLLPVIASVSYEIIKLTSIIKNKTFFRIILSLGLLIQKISTKEPTKKQIEVAVKALNTVSAMEKA